MHMAHMGILRRFLKVLPILNFIDFIVSDTLDMSYQMGHKAFKWYSNMMHSRHEIGNGLGNDAALICHFKMHLSYLSLHG